MLVSHQKSGISFKALNLLTASNRGTEANDAFATLINTSFFTRLIFGNMINATSMIIDGSMMTTIGKTG